MFPASLTFYRAIFKQLLDLDKVDINNKGEHSTVACPVKRRGCVRALDAGKADVDAQDIGTALAQPNMGRGLFQAAS